MKPKPKILVAIDWFTPAFKAGGPIRSVNNFIEALKDEFDFYVLTSDRDLHDQEAFSDVALNEWIDRGGYQVYYLSQDRQNKAVISTLLNERDYERYYFNSLFSFKFSLLPIWLLKQSKRSDRIILAPRGMLGAGALQLKGKKKKAFLAMAKVMGLFRRIRWHATSEEEKQEILQHFPKANIRLARNLAKKVDTAFKIHPKQPNELRLVFLSRISPKKNLLYALELIKAFPLAAGQQLSFHIYGPIEDQSYWEKCESLMHQMGEGKEVSHGGLISRAKIHATLANYHAMLFPTLNENYGHNIVESLSVGIPVIISDCTPWNDLGDYQAGWAIPLQDKALFMEKMRDLLQMDQQQFDQMVAGSRKYAADKFYSGALVAAHLRIFEA